jgi:hypothetical protein
MCFIRLIENNQRLGFFGLAKNTGKTVALNACLAELAQTSETVGITSIGYDGESVDSINSQIKKPKIFLREGTLVATTSQLLNRSQVPYKRLLTTDLRTALGTVVVARLTGCGAVEIAGPSAAADISSLCDFMISQGATKILIDGAINRKAAASPLITDGVIISTGAVLAPELHEVVSETEMLIDNFRLKPLEERQVQTLFQNVSKHAAMLDDGTVSVLPGEIATSESTELLKAHIPESIRFIFVKGALTESFIERLFRLRKGKKITLVIRDATCLFLTRRSFSWYEEKGVSIRVIRQINIRAVTVNPVSPASHEFDSVHFREEISRILPDTPVFNALESQKYAPGTNNLSA